MQVPAFRYWLQRALLAIVLGLLAAASSVPARMWDVLRISLEQLHRDYSPESVFLHTDRSVYQAGETLWFKAWHTEGYRHLPSDKAVVLRLELINPMDGISQTHLLRAIEGQACGSLLLPDTLPEGRYILRLSTARMRSFSPPLSHHHEISLVSEKNNAQSRKLSRRMQNEAPVVIFSPEGGPLLAGVESRVGLRVTDAFGQGIASEFKVDNGRGTLVNSGKTKDDGFGSFNLTPADGEKYLLRLEVAGEKTRSFRLPDVENSGAALSVKRIPEGFHFSLRSRGLQGPYLLIVQDVSGLRHHQVLEADTGGKVILPERSLQPGICTATAFDAHGRPLSERHFFSGLSTLHLIQAGIKTQEENDSIILNINIPEAMTADRPLFSLSVTTLAPSGSPFPDHPQVPAMAAFHLGEIIREYRGDPGRYFNGEAGMEDALDEVLLTLRWSRYAWQNLAQGKLPPPLASNAGDLGIQGRVSRLFLDQPAARSIVKMTVMDRHFDQLIDTADENGRFSFGGLVYEDTIHLLLEARLPDGRSQVLIDVEGATDGEKPLPGKFTAPLNYTGESVLGLDNQLLDRKRGNPGSKRQSAGIHREADYVIHFDEKTRNYRSPLEALVNVPGVDLTGSGMNTRVIIRGNSTIMLSNDPLYVVDGVPVDRFSVNALDAGEVERIEVLSGTRAAIYGMRGGNGVVAIYTRRGSGVKAGELALKVLGFTGCKTFHNPTNSGNLPGIVPLTLGWFPRLQPALGSISVKVPKPPDGIGMQYQLEGIARDGKIFSSGRRGLP